LEGNLTPLPPPLRGQGPGVGAGCWRIRQCLIPRMVRGKATLPNPKPFPLKGEGLVLAYQRYRNVADTACAVSEQDSSASHASASTDREVSRVASAAPARNRSRSVSGPSMRKDPAGALANAA